jgi:DNA-binding response OmpR family regulator
MSMLHRSLRSSSASQAMQVPPLSSHPASPLLHEVLCRVCLSPTEQHLLWVLAQASPSPLSDATLLSAGGASWHVGQRQLQARLQELRWKLSPHGLALVRVFNYGYLLLLAEAEQTNPK